MNLNHFENYTAMRATTVAIVLLVWAAALESPLSAQQSRRLPEQERTPTQASAPEQGVSSILTNTDKDYLISPGDVIEIRVEDAPEISHLYQVTVSGEIEMPVLGRMVARQKTTYEFSRLIADGLRQQEYLKSPNVVVTVTRYNSQAFFIQGAVGKPGLYELKG